MIFRQIIIDNILSNPHEATEIARSMEYGPFGDGYYQGRTSMKQIMFVEVENVIKSLFPGKEHMPYSSRFRMAKKGEEQANVIHCDHGCQLSGILYLTEDSRDVYTSFFQDKLGCDNFVDFKKLSPNTTDEELFEDFKDQLKWTEIYRVHGKFNRLILFDSMLWHAPSLGFGDNKDNSRLVQVFFLKGSK